ncbi:MAG TPA: efflux RND transporter periplasmic adaptor subunit [Casimicrobiaceae bacterium]|nr:efflux RND transporter periplasmic adaptor subunit [Casimicrobiaceae bacterium]
MPTLLVLSLRAAVLVGVVSLAACSNDKEPAGKAASPAAPPPAQVGVVTVQPQTVTLTRELSGRVSPFLVAEVRPQVGGIIRKRLFTEGGRVKAGQPLYQLDDAIPRADQAVAVAALRRAEATLASARQNAARSAELVKIDAVSQQDNDNAIAAQRQAEAEVASARAAVERNNVVLGYATIVAPIGGRIGKSSVTQGALVTANQAEPLATIQQLDQVYVDVTQSSADLLELRRQVASGQLEAKRDFPVTILLEDGSRYPQPGRLTFADVTVDPATGSYLLRVVVPNAQDVLLPGMYVRALVGSGVRENGILVPQQGVARDPKGNTSVMVVGPDGVVQARAVRVSRAVGSSWLVDDGLQAGDQVIVEGLQKVKPGMPAKGVAPSPSAPAGAAAAPAPGGAPAKAGAAPPPAPAATPDAKRTER